MDTFAYLEIVVDLNAAPEHVFAAWTQAELLSQWWGPAGFNLIVRHLDATPGGHFLYEMKNEQASMFGRFDYLAIEAPSRITYLNSFANAEGETIPAPFGNDWPLHMHNVLQLHAPETGGTQMLLQSRAHNATPAQADTFAANFDNMRAGFAGTMEKLKALFA